MKPDLAAQLPVYRRIENEIRSHIARKKLIRHAPLPSEAQLARTFGASIGTVRKALNNLTTERLIYRRHGQGTFVAPRSRRGKFLVVSNLQMRDGHHVDFFDFYLGALQCANQLDLEYEPLLVDPTDFLNNLNDLEMVYPECAGVLFFRGFGKNLTQETFAALRAHKLPCMYYGPNIYDDLPQDCPAVFHNERIIAELIAEHDAALGIRCAGGIDFKSMIGMVRNRLLEEALTRRNIRFIKLHHETPDAIKQCEIVHAPTDCVAVIFIQKIERDYALRVPHDLKVSGVDNAPSIGFSPLLTTVSLCNRENGALCMELFSEFCRNNPRKPPRVDGKLELIRRASC